MAAPATYPIVICADDFGLSTAVSEGIAELIARGRLTATGAMTGLPGWRRHAAQLRSLVAEHPADVGLHFTLTGQAPITAAAGVAVDGRLPSIGTLTRAAVTRALPLAVIRDELAAQLDAFEDAWGGAPDFLDGHQHCHILPGVRSVVMEELARRYGNGSRRPWMRSCGENLTAAARRRIGFAKAATIAGFDLGLKGMAARHGLPTNDSFRGFYDFSPKYPYGAVFRAALTGGGRRILVHCHPGRVDDELIRLDPLTTPREHELAYLASEECGRDLAAAGVHPARFRDLPA